jgi:molybdopterin/thiamine biosynthesis adenylyltransferase
MKSRDEQRARYSRHLLLQEVGHLGQEKLQTARVLIIGVGGLGSPAALYLAAAGVGTIGLVDPDRVELSNLNRQIIYQSQDISHSKAEVASQRLGALNPHISVRQYPVRVDESNILELISQYDFVIDGTDNFSSKFLINDACVIAQKPFSHAGVVRFSGQTITVLPRASACYRCVFYEPPPSGEVPSTAEVGVLGAVAGVIGAIQSIEALKYLLGRRDLITNTLLTWNALTMEFRRVAIARSLKCPVCGENPTIVAV